MSIEIRYNHTSKQTADNYATALDMVRTQAIQTVGGHKAADTLVEIEADGGTYIYLDQESADRDATGARAFAVIESVED